MLALPPSVGVCVLHVLPMPPLLAAVRRKESSVNVKVREEQLLMADGLHPKDIVWLEKRIVELEASLKRCGDASGG